MESPQINVDDVVDALHAKSKHLVAIVLIFVIIIVIGVVVDEVFDEIKFPPKMDALDSDLLPSHGTLGFGHRE